MQHETDEVLRWLVKGITDIYPWLYTINTKLEAVLSNQDELDARSARIEAATAAVKAEVDDLKAQVAAGAPAESLDFSRLDAAISGEEGLEPAVAAAPAPADPAPVAPVDPTVTPLDNAVAGNAGGADAPSA